MFFWLPNCIRSVINVPVRDPDECKHVAYRFFQLNRVTQHLLVTGRTRLLFFFVMKRTDKIIDSESIAVITCIHVKMAVSRLLY